MISFLLDRVNFTCANIDTKHLKEVKDVEIQTNANLFLQSTANKKIQTSKLLLVLSLFYNGNILLFIVVISTINTKKL